MNWDIIGVHDFPIDPCSNGLFEAVACIIPEDHKTLELEAAQQSFRLVCLPLTLIPILQISEC